jgi:hypothetical protein
MASEARIPFLGDVEECEEREVPLGSKNDGIPQKSDGSELVGNSQTHAETELCAKNESVTEEGASEEKIEETQNENGESSNVTNTGSQLASEIVDSTEIDTNASKPVEVTGDKTNDKGNQDAFSTGSQLESKVLASTDNSSEIDINVPKVVDVTGGTSTDDGSQDATGMETKQVNEAETKVEGVPSTSSESPFADDKSKDSALWYDHVLLVRGLPPREAGVSLSLTYLSTLIAALFFN